MSNSQELAVWKKRWNALDKTMATMETSFAGWQSMGFSRMETLQNLVKCLRVFATGQFHFFYYGFGGEQKPPNLDTHVDYPPHYVLRGVINQIFHDVEVIQRAANQRVYSSAEMKKTLATADKLAWAALEPATRGNLLIPPETTVITYFQKFGSIRVIPYAPVALIGIPFSCMEAPRDFLAIPHEVGHYVYRHGKINTGTYTAIRKALDGEFTAYTTITNEEWARKWIEEIFADVYGCLIASLVIALDFQDLQLEHSPEGLVEDDGSHPVPSLRPKIYTSVLRNQGQSPLADALDERWEGKLGNGFKEFKPKGINVPQSHSAVMGSDGPVKKIVSEALTKLRPFQQQLDDTNWWKIASSAAVAGINLSRVVGLQSIESDLQGMYKNFEARLRLDPDLVGSYMPPDVKLPEFKASTECETVNLNSADPVGDWHTKPYFKTIFDLENPEWWVDVWIAEGWTTRGNGRWVL